MAKKKKKKEEEKYDFKFPKFDKKEYLEKEMRDAKVTFVTIGYAIIMVIITFFVAKIDVKLGLLVCIIGMVTLKKLYESIGFDTITFEKKNWFGHGAIYFFTWLGFWILLSNPPIVDNAPPFIQDIGYAKNTDFSNGTIAIGDNITIWANVSDNTEVKNVSITISIDNEIIFNSENMENIEDDKYIFTISNVIDTKDGEYRVIISASDKNGHSTQKSEGFKVPGKAKIE